MPKSNHSHGLCIRAMGQSGSFVELGHQLISHGCDKLRAEWKLLTIYQKCF